MNQTNTWGFPLSPAATVVAGLTVLTLVPIAALLAVAAPRGPVRDTARAVADPAVVGALLIAVVRALLLWFALPFPSLPNRRTTAVTRASCGNESGQA